MLGPIGDADRNTSRSRNHYAFVDLDPDPDAERGISTDNLADAYPSVIPPQLRG
jgi:hypothetical protein